MYIRNPSLEFIVSNIVKMCTDIPSNKLIVSRNKLQPTDHLLAKLTENIDYNDQDVLDIFQHEHLKHVHINNVAHGFKNIHPHSNRKGDIIWCVGDDSVNIVGGAYGVVQGIDDEERLKMNIDLVNCGSLLTWNEILGIVKEDSQCRIGWVHKSDVIYHIGVDTYRTLSMKITKEIPVPLAFSGSNPSDRLWFIYKETQTNSRINDELKSYRVVYL